MARLRYNILRTVLSTDLLIGDTSIDFGSSLQEGEVDIATVSSPDTLALRIGNEIMWLTDYTSGATTGTVLRAQEDTVEEDHLAGALVGNVITKEDVSSGGGGSEQLIIGPSDAGGSISVTHDPLALMSQVFAETLNAGDSIIVNTTGEGSSAIIHARTNTLGSADAYAAGAGSLAHGVVTTYGNGSAVLDAHADGTLVSGYAYSKGGGDAFIQSNSRGSQAIGAVSAGKTAGYAHMQITGSGGSLVQGRVYSGEGSGTSKAKMTASASGNLVAGWVYSNADVSGGISFAALQASSAGATASGGAGAYNDAGSGTAYSLTTASARSSHVFGYTYTWGSNSNGVLSAQTRGAMAMGYIYAYGGGRARIGSTGVGSFAGGYVYGKATGGLTGSTYATAKGSMAFGSVYAETTTATIQASGLGSLAIGYAHDNVIKANANNAWQFGPGTIAEAYAMQIGDQIRFKGTVGAFGSPANGDIYVDGGGNVIIRSGGVDVTIA